MEARVETDRPRSGERPRRPGLLAAVTGAPIGLLGGLIGLGGAEFRLPVLAGLFGYRAHRAIVVNLAISLITVVSALAIRSATLSIAPLKDLFPVMAAIALGGVLAAWLGAAVLHRLSEAAVERAIMFLLAGIGTALIVEAFLPVDGGGGIVPDIVGWELAVASLFGLAVGAVSSALGVAGGELIIPALVFGFGADIATAGTASLAISVPMVTVGLGRHALHGASPHSRDFAGVILPMGMASILGAIAGGLLAGLAPAALLKAVLGAVLIVSAVRVFREHPSASAPRREAR